MGKLISLSICDKIDSYNDHANAAEFDIILSEDSKRLPYDRIGFFCSLMSNKPVHFFHNSGLKIFAASSNAQVILSSVPKNTDLKINPSTESG